MFSTGLHRVSSVLTIVLYMLAGIHTFMGDYSGVYENENIVDEEATTDLMLLCKSYNIVL